MSSSTKYDFRQENSSAIFTALYASVYYAFAKPIKNLHNEFHILKLILSANRDVEDRWDMPQAFREAVDFFKYRYIQVAIMILSEEDIWVSIRIKSAL